MANAANIELIVFDWGDTLMRDFADFDGPMADWPKVEAIGGACEAVASLYGRYTLAVASNAGDSDASLLGQALERVGLRRYFAHLLTSKELGAAKPSPAFFEGVCRRAGVSCTRAVMVGNDYAKDIVGAKAAGLRTVWLAEGRPSSSAEAADAIIPSLGVLPDALAHLAEASG